VLKHAQPDIPLRDWSQTLPKTINLRLKITLGFAMVLIVAAEGYRMVYDKLNPGLLEIGSLAPDFKTQTLDGKPLTLSPLRGKVVLLDFWATWCGPCRMATPLLISLQSQYHSQGLEVVGISTDDQSSAAQVPDFVKQSGMNYSVSANPLVNSGIALAYRADSLPTQYLIDKHGRIRWSQQGFSTDEQYLLPQVLQKLLAEP
jgi:cytochrome c biogenesis protein CcmG/thiol:disulfide interchange protein DsbE